MPANRIHEFLSADWPEFQKPGVYLVHGTTESGAEQLYIGKGENIAKRVQAHPDKLDFEIISLLLFSSKDFNLNGSQVGWLESSLIRAVKAAKRIALTNIQSPEPPTLSKPELATVLEFFDDLRLIAQTAGFDYFSPPKPFAAPSSPASEAVPAPSGANPEFIFHQPVKGITARGYLSDDGFVVKAGSDASSTANPGFTGSYAALRKTLIDQGVIIPNPNDPSKMTLAIDYAFGASSKAAAIVAGSNMPGPKCWKTSAGLTLGDYLASLAPSPPEPPPAPSNASSPVNS
jgi:hypothetical protein